MFHYMQPLSHQNVHIVDLFKLGFEFESDQLAITILYLSEVAQIRMNVWKFKWTIPD
jgi:hypothetical protein